MCVQRLQVRVSLAPLLAQRPQVPSMSYGITCLAKSTASMACGVTWAGAWDVSVLLWQRRARLTAGGFVPTHPSRSDYSTTVVPDGCDGNMASDGHRRQVA